MFRCFFLAVMLGLCSSKLCKQTARKLVKVYSTKRTWDDAQKFCNGIKLMDDPGTLVVDDDSVTHSFLNAQKYLGDMWIGGSDRKSYKNWKWVNGASVPVPDKKWAPGEPNNGGSSNSQHCMVMNYLTKYWDDQSCATKHPFACQWVTPKSYDMVDGRLVSYHRGSATYACRGSNYERLLVADTKAINKWLANRKESTWIGASDVANEGKWVWSNGKQVTTNFWAKGEPNNSGRAEHCALFVPDKEGRISGWEDHYCGEDHAYACEHVYC